MFNIMIVDDEELERKALKVILKELKEVNIIAEACNGREAIEFDKKYNPDLIIMDVKMPGFDGCKAAEIIKANNKERIIIMVTAHDDFELVRKALVLGVNDYILKPVRPREIINIVNNIIVNYKINNKGENTDNKSIVEEYKEEISPIDKALKYIDENFKDNINLNTIADKCNLSSCYFSKLFKREVGVNFSQYLKNKKIQHAKKLLKTTEIPILNIAIDLGFEDCGYFIRVFKNIEGITPKKYREKNE
ncbi:YesN/AraC family two-component response regulator [Clostridium moniliforme]|uniref:Stage 0 sporulation protein A homolog n=1 Tax=Clostridium moniliforme TaxID=39489 RepID=A0ABS4EZQ6_9CLOT|nr:response regulator [Clostridium moniliforme]MBP1889476.1 YesN/AraC family two-component response regulator [Clostridium moniliforme]